MIQQGNASAWATLPDGGMNCANFTIALSSDGYLLGLWRPTKKANWLGRAVTRTTRTSRPPSG